MGYFGHRWLLIGYIAALFLTLPIALPVWNGFLRDTLGRWVKVEQVHLIQYAGLGWVTALFRPGCSVLALVIIVGLCDEFVQGWLPQRTFEWSDVWLNWLGGLGGFLLYQWCGLMRQGCTNHTGDRYDV